jgi:hypothetical protein
VATASDERPREHGTYSTDDVREMSEMAARVHGVVGMVGAPYRRFHRMRMREPARMLSPSSSECRAWLQIRR